MKSTKYQLLKDDFNLALKDIKLRNERINELQEEVTQLRRVKLITDKSYRELLFLCDEYEKALQEIKSIGNAESVYIANKALTGD